MAKQKKDGSKDNPPAKKEASTEAPKYPSPTVYEPGKEQPINLPKGVQLGEE